jgi:small subunit ribosomal protein S8
MLTDPIADMLTRIRNALAARHPKVDVPASRLKAEIARILKEEGYIQNFKVAEEGVRKTIKVYLKYQPSGRPVISRLERVSRPGSRVYVGRDDVPRVLGGLGVNILTTPRGVMTGRDARQAGVGGEILCQVWRGEWSCHVESR